MPYNTRLGICIPTYKRPDQLRLCVRSLIASAAPHNVPIFIADDSADSTNTALIAELQALYPHIVYEKNAVNLGIDGNIIHSVDICDCDYAWLIGEDDRMLPEAVPAALETLGTADLAFVAANYSYVDEDISVILREKRMMLEADRSESSEIFLRQDAWGIGFIGSCIINTRLWRGVQPEKYFGTYFAHVGVILESIAGKTVNLIARPLVLNRVGGAETFTWSGDAYGVFHGWAKMTALLEPIYGKEACDASAASFEHNHGLNTLRFMMAKRADRLYTLEIYRKFIQGSQQRRMHKLAAHLIARLGPQPFRILRNLLFSVRKQQNRRVTDLP